MVVPAIVGAGLGLIQAGLQSRAMRRAAEAQARAAERSNMLARQVMQARLARLDPYAGRGDAAGGAINALLGLGGGGGGGGYASTGPGYTDEEALAFLRSTADGKTAKRIRRAGTLADAMGYADSGELERLNSWIASRQSLMPRWTEGDGDQGGASTERDQEDAFERWRNSTGYQFRLGEGANALQQRFAARGLLQSGPAMRALTRFGQDYATGSFNDYLRALQGQQAVGLSGAIGSSGVLGGYGDDVQRGYQTAADAMSNRALGNAAAWGNALGQAGNAFGQVLGSRYGGGGSGGVGRGQFSPTAIMGRLDDYMRRRF